MSLGKFLSVFDFVVKAVLPGTLALAGVPADKVPSIVALAGDAEAALGPGSGAQKLQSVLDGVAQGMAVKGAEPATIQTVQEAAATGINAAFAIAKDVHSLHVSATAPLAGV